MKVQFAGVTGKCRAGWD